ncbi:YciI family protein [Pseudomonas sp. Marseille-QA0892]
MPYYIETFDKPDSAQLRADNRPDHLEFLRQNASKLLACGAKLNAEGAATGSTYILDVETEQEAKAFLDQDPFTQVGLPGDVRMTYWRKAVLDGKAFV